MVVSLGLAAVGPRAGIILNDPLSIAENDGVLGPPKPEEWSLFGNLSDADITVFDVLNVIGVLEKERLSRAELHPDEHSKFEDNYKLK